MIRKYVEVTMPLPEGARLLHPEAAMLRWEGVKARNDVGQFCYLVRETSGHQRSHTYDKTSLDPSRIEAVQKLVTHLSDRLRISSMRPATLANRTKNIGWFVTWADNQKLPGVLVDKEQTEAALSAYFRHLRDRVSRSDMSKNTAANLQRETTSELSAFFECDNFGSTIQLISGSSKHTVNTVVPEPNDQGIVLAWANALFSAISANVLSFDPYPYEVCLGEFGNSTKRLVVLPVLGNGYSKAWDRETGRILSYQELKSICFAESPNWYEQRADTARREAAERLERVNSDRRDKLRLSHATLALMLFNLMFMAETGCNLSQLISIDWHPDFDANVAFSKRRSSTIP